MSKVSKYKNCGNRFLLYYMSKLTPTVSSQSCRIKVHRTTGASIFRLLIRLSTDTSPEAGETIISRITFTYKGGIVMEILTHAHRSKRDGSVVVVFTTASPVAVTLNSISVLSCNHAAHAGLISVKNLRFGLSERTTDRND